MAPRKRKNKSSKSGKKKEDQEEEVIDMFGTAETNGQSDFAFPMPPMMGQQMEQDKAAAKKKNDDADDSDDDDDDEVDDLPKQSKFNQAAAKQANGEPVKLAKADKGINWVPVVFLCLMFGTTLIPALLFVGDSVSGYLAKNDIMGSIGYRLGIGSVPRKRVISFYEKHNPEKLADVPKVLAKHYGDYPKLIRKLERKYQDYGYFMGWEEDEAPMRMVKDQLDEAYSVWIQQYWNKYAPVMVRTRVRNIKYNLTTVYKQGRKLWKKHVWPLLEPLFGVPDAKTAAKQKRMDAKMAQERAQQQRTATGSGSTRKKNTEFRDDVED